jgi:hypothetical protein
MPRSPRQDRMLRIDEIISDNEVKEFFLFRIDLSEGRSWTDDLDEANWPESPIQFSTFSVFD